MISQRKLAEILNLTQSAVSAALREGGTGTSKVAPETRKMVLEAARKYGYRTNRYASVLRTGKSNLIAVLHGPLTPDWIGKVQAVCDEIEARGYSAWTIDMRRFKGGADAVLDAVLQSKVEGVIAGPYSAKLDVTPYMKANIPTVSFIAHAPRGAQRYIHVGPNKADGFYNVTRHLIEQGCERITICAGIRSHIPVEPGITTQATSNQAIVGMEQYYADYRKSYVIEPITYLDPEIVFHGTDEYRQGYLLAKEALKQKPDALIYTNDSRALGGMFALREAGLRVPHDICVTGFNNEHYGPYNWIPLTTVEQPVRAMAKDAVSQLMNQMEDPSCAPTGVHLHLCKLIPRESSLRREISEPEPLSKQASIGNN